MLSSIAFTAQLTSIDGRPLAWSNEPDVSLLHLPFSAMALGLFLLPVFPAGILHQVVYYNGLYILVSNPHLAHISLVLFVVSCCRYLAAFAPPNAFVNDNLLNASYHCFASFNPVTVVRNPSTALALRVVTIFGTCRDGSQWQRTIRV